MNFLQKKYRNFVLRQTAGTSLNKYRKPHIIQMEEIIISIICGFMANLLYDFFRKAFLRNR